ncbi:MAG: restriction endonuclease subunit S [Pseudohongiella sp.]|nr:restriction endonuclease subunit S [Pseudohongiella sp.]
MNWPLVKLSDVVEVNPRPPKGINSSQQVSFIGMASASNEGFLLNEEMRVLSDTKKGFTYFEKSDVLLAKITPCFENGKCLRANQISKPIGFGSTEFHVLRVNPVKVDSTYLFYIVWSDQFRLLGEASMSGAAGQKRVSAKFLKEFKFPLPPLVEQKRIAAILDKADSIRRKRKQAIQFADEFRHAVFLDMFGDPVTNPKGLNKLPITELADVITGYAFKSSEYVDCSQDAVRLCRGTNTLTGHFDWSDTVYWPKNRLDDLESYLLSTGDVVLALDRPWISSGLKVCVFKENDLPTYLVQRVARLRPKEPAHSAYIYGCIKASAFERHCCPTETTVPHISPIELKSFQILIPEPRLLNKFHAVAVKTERHIGMLASSACESDAFFRSLAKKTFSGQL